MSMPPADPTPPLTAERLNEFRGLTDHHLSHFIRMNARADAGDPTYAMAILECAQSIDLIVAYAALTAQLTEQLDAYEHLAENNQDALDALRVAEQQLAQRTAERDAARERHRAVENILRNVEEHHVQQNQWKGRDETRSHTLKWIREARAILADPTEGR